MFFLVVPGSIYANDGERDLLLEMAPKLYTYLVSNYYDILRTHGSMHYKNYLGPIFSELGCDLDESNVSRFNDILLNAQSAADFSNNVSQKFECH